MHFSPLQAQLVLDFLRVLDEFQLLPSLIVKSIDKLMILFDQSIEFLLIGLHFLSVHNALMLESL